jgi:hypothetical protein
MVPQIPLSSVTGTQVNFLVNSSRFRLKFIWRTMQTVNSKLNVEKADVTGTQITP